MVKGSGNSSGPGTKSFHMLPAGLSQRIHLREPLPGIRAASRCEYSNGPERIERTTRVRVRIRVGASVTGSTTHIPRVRCDKEGKLGASL